MWLFESFRAVANTLKYVDCGGTRLQVRIKEVLDFPGNDGLSGLLVNDKSFCISNLQIQFYSAEGRLSTVFTTNIALFNSSYLVDPASSHMLVSKIKPCMSKYKHYTVKLRMAH